MNRDNDQADIHPLKFSAFMGLGFMAASSVSAFASAAANGYYEPALFHAMTGSMWLGVSHGVMKDRSEKALGLKGHLGGYFFGAALCMALPEPYGEWQNSTNGDARIEIVEPGATMPESSYIPYP